MYFTEIKSHFLDVTTCCICCFADSCWRTDISVPISTTCLCSQESLRASRFLRVRQRKRPFSHCNCNNSRGQPSTFANEKATKFRMQRFKNCNRMVFQQNTLTAIMKCLLFLAVAQAAGAWSTKMNGPRRRSFGVQRPPVTMYVPSNSPTTETPSITAQKMLKIPGTSTLSNSVRKSTLKLSQSVLASCDTLPSFRTAHGILSPETVLRMEEMVNEEDRSEALKQFLNHYRRKGPMACLPMLSDPDILPHLTMAMRSVLE